MSSRDPTDTPDELELTLQRLRAKRKRAVDALPSQAPPDFDDDEVSEVTFRGEAAVVIARQQAGVVTRIQNSFAPVSQKMGSPAGKRAALVAGIVSSVGLIIEVLRQLGAFKGGP